MKGPDNDDEDGGDEGAAVLPDQPEDTNASES